MANDTVSFKLEIREEDKRPLLELFDKSGELKNSKQDFFIKNEESSFSLQVKNYSGSVPLDKAFILSLKDGNIICTVNPSAHNKNVNHVKKIIDSYFKHKPIERDDFIGLNSLLDGKVHHLDSSVIDAVLNAINNKQEINVRSDNEVKFQKQEIEQLKTKKTTLEDQNEDFKKNLRIFTEKNKKLKKERLESDNLIKDYTGKIESLNQQIESLNQQIYSLKGNSHQKTEETKSISHPETILFENTATNSGSMLETSSSDQNSANEGSSSASEEKGNRGKKIAIGLASSLSVLSLGASITLGVLAFTTTVLAPLAPAFLIVLIVGAFLLSGISLSIGLALAHSNKSISQDSGDNVSDILNAGSSENEHSLLKVDEASVSTSDSLKRSESAPNIAFSSSPNMYFLRINDDNSHEENPSTNLGLTK